VEDTSPRATARYFDLLRQAGPAKRLAICASLTAAARELAAAGIRASHPGRDLSAEEIRAKLAARIYGDEVARRMLRRRPG